MKYLKQFAGKMLVLTSTLGLGAALAAPPSAAVFQRTTNTESVELSNIDETDTAQVPVSTSPAAQSGAGAAEAKSLAAARNPGTPAKVAKKVKKKIRLADGTEEEVLVDADEDGTEQADAATGGSDARTASGARNNSESMGMGGNGGYSAAAGSSGGGYASGGYAGSGSQGTGTNTASGGGSGGSSSGTGTNTAASGSGSTGGGSATVPALPAPTSSLETKLETYRNLMLNDVTHAQVSNPAITRRYQMMNRTTYQSLMGL
jgi:hypothetical protein